MSNLLGDKSASNYSSPSIHVFKISVKNTIMVGSPDNQAIIDDPNIIDD